MSRLWSCPASSSLLCPRFPLTHYAVQRLFGVAASYSVKEAEARSQPGEKVRRLADISTLTLLEVSGLTTLLGQKLGFPAGMGMIPMGMLQMSSSSTAAPATEEEPQKSEKTSFEVKLQRFDATAKVKIIKEVRRFTALGLKEAKELVEKAPVVVKAGLGKDEAEQIVEKLKSVGAIALMT